MSPFSIPNLSLVVLVGPSGSGKSTFAARHFRRTEVLSSDFCRGLVSDDEGNQAASRDAFDVLHYIAAKRLSAGRLTVIDATNLRTDARRPLRALALEHQFILVAIVFDLPEEVCLARDRARPDRNVGKDVLGAQRLLLERTLRNLPRQGFDLTYILRTPEEADAATIERVPFWCELTERP